MSNVAIILAERNARLGVASSQLFMQRWTPEFYRERVDAIEAEFKEKLERCKMGFLVSKLARDVAEWTARHDGVSPRRITMSQDLYDAIVEENRKYMVDDKKCHGAFICGVPIHIDLNKKLADIE